ncbi:MAG: hypothetical protein HY437_02515 [Candidatus Magasanikbacteria bacterium]|nr:hypothetical protein [Candidatus Magasanikbacteria bacterium]
MSVFRTLSGDVGVSTDGLSATEAGEVHEALKRIKRMTDWNEAPIWTILLSVLAAVIVSVTVGLVFDLKSDTFLTMSGVASLILGSSLLSVMTYTRYQMDQRDYAELMRLVAINERVRVLYDTCLVVKQGFGQACARALQQQRAEAGDIGYP